ncbi:ABC transporter substrate-binding protein [Arcanobacterium ihumii]|uniref:ABC transporter substrate-binding protein n=1 Tax=Arcanobacterium ihumii TaxID=2138162 RepID=UPI000F52ADAC|nr:ABC transporter substrate-binding protein [Arcanobacterium ihumii]
MKKISSLIAGVALLAAGCSTVGTGASESASSNSNSSTSNTMTVGLTYIPDVQFAPLYVAEKKGYFKSEGLNVKLRHHGAQENLFGALSAGEEDVVFAGGDEMMQARSTGIDVVNWATMYQKYPVVVATVAESGIKSWKDLQGKTIGLPGPYGENYFGLLAGAELNGLQGKFQTSFIGYTQAAALKDKKVDAIVGFANNDPVALEKAGFSVNIFPIADDVRIPLVGVGFGSLSNNIRPEAYAKFLNAVEKGVKDAKEDPEGTLDIVANYVPSLSGSEQRATAKEVLARTVLLYEGTKGFGVQDDAVWKNMAEFMKRADITKTLVEATEAHTDVVLKKRNE